MSIIKRLPSTMQEIRWNYKGSEGEIKSNERYVRDMRQMGYNGEWDLEGYDGMAYGLQYKLDDYGWGTHGDVYKLSKEHSDKRIDGAITHRADNEIDWDGDGQRGKYFWLWIDQSRYDRTPGAISINGWWYADEPGDYRVKMKLETVDDWEADARIYGAVLGFRHGYLDGARKDYILNGVSDLREKNTIYEYDSVFTVDSRYRHIVMNYCLWQGGGYGRNAMSHARVHNVTVEKI